MSGKAVVDLLVNRRARRDYTVLDTYEAGLVLLGSEVKSLRQGKGQLEGAYAQIEGGEAWLYQANIPIYANAASFTTRDPKARRKLLLHRAEIRKLFGAVSLKGRALIPLKLYWKNGTVKVLLGLGVGKAEHDKREELRSIEAKKDIRTALHRRR
ncbi:SsrA-binding protein SmpB [Methylacidimicrobium tartarophylax]|uniref:SsrA-binding protein n=1 Tax=Methylacidimicrobium tartarophylax TaxID=1041768 RepID=A0A5E6MD94_9BACT|nr:SsrA-binding protein SmpB [Methylacidimicrobium tartarophylax]VVM07420.1 SsrA-binding protein [Methylacidimicrobium tartarophylax]